MHVTLIALLSNDVLYRQIAPFQVDFAVKEMSLDFSSVKNAGNALFSLA